MTMITPSYLGETIEYSSLHACRSTLEDPTPHWWQVTDIRLGGRSVKSDWGQYGWPHTWTRTREESLLLGERLIEWHRDRHLWWMPLREEAS